MAKTKLPVAQMVTINTRSAAAIWNMGYKKWQRLFDRSLKHHIRHYLGENGRRYVLIDVMQLAYPGADGRTVHSMCLDYTMAQANIRSGRSRFNKEREEPGNADSSRVAS